MKHAESKHEKSAAKKSPEPSAHAQGEAPTTTTAPVPQQPMIEQAELDALREKAKLADVNWDKLLRMAADFENYKRRASREKEEAVQREREGLVLKILPLVDALETGLAALQSQAQAGSVEEGLRMVKNMFVNFLAECGVEEIAAVGQPFDPVSHHAVGQEPSEQVAQDLVLRQQRKGFRMGGRVLRAADVVVSMGTGRK